MDNDVTISKIMDAIEIANRVEELKKFVFNKRKDLIHEIGALRTVDVERNGVQDYFHYQQISDILYHITTPDKGWTVGRCCGEIITELRQ